MRSRWIIGNWKQNVLTGAAVELAGAVADGLGDVPDHTHVGVAPSYLCLPALNTRLGAGGPLHRFAQDVAAQESGAFTGEVGPSMLADVGARGSLIGHSERRAYYGDDDARVAAKVQSALAGGLDVVLCVGEPLEIREAGTHESHVISQLSAALAEVSPEAAERIVLAYEPVWAIGTGKTATPEQAASMHGAIRRWLRERYDGAPAADRSILYGGSVKPGNAAALMAAGDIDGFLVGGASLDAASFLDIVRAVAAA